jgi:hypothetical protein
MDPTAPEDGRVMTTTSQLTSGDAGASGSTRRQCGQARTLSLAPELAADGFVFLGISSENLLTSSRITAQPLPGVEIQWRHPADPRATTRKEEIATNALLDLYNYLNGLAFGEKEMGMPNWVMWDLAVLPSALLVIATENRAHFNRLITKLIEEREALRTSAPARKQVNKQRAVERALEQAMELNRYADSDYTGPMPVAGYCASPTPVDGHWLGWSLCSLEIGRNLGTVAKGTGLAVYNTTVLDGVTQYGHRSIGVHTQFGLTRIRAPLLEGHTAPHTFVYETQIFTADEQTDTHGQPTYEAANAIYTGLCDLQDSEAVETLSADDEQAQSRLRDRIADEDFLILPSVPWDAHSPLRIQARPR